MESVYTGNRIEGSNPSLSASRNAPDGAAPLRRASLPGDAWRPRAAAAWPEAALGVVAEAHLSALAVATVTFPGTGFDDAWRRVLAALPELAASRWADFQGAVLAAAGRNGLAIALLRATSSCASSDLRSEARAAAALEALSGWLVRSYRGVAPDLIAAAKARLSGRRGLAGRFRSCPPFAANPARAASLWMRALEELGVAAAPDAASA